MNGTVTISFAILIILNPLEALIATSTFFGIYALRYGYHEHSIIYTPEEIT